MIKRQLTIFLSVGTCSVLLDFVSYNILIALTPLPINATKALSFVFGTIFSYLANRYWTFNQQNHAQGSIWRFVLVYSASLICNVLINAATLSLLAEKLYALQLAFLLAAAISASLNFLGMKLFVFKDCSKTRPLKNQQIND